MPSQRHAHHVPDCEPTMPGQRARRCFQNTSLRVAAKATARRACSSTEFGGLSSRVVSAAFVGAIVAPPPLGCAAAEDRPTAITPTAKYRLSGLDLEATWRQWGRRRDDDAVTNSRVRGGDSGPTHRHPVSWRVPRPATPAGGRRPRWSRSTPGRFRRHASDRQPRARSPIPRARLRRPRVWPRRPQRSPPIR